MTTIDYKNNQGWLETKCPFNLKVNGFQNRTIFVGSIQCDWCQFFVNRIGNTVKCDHPR